MSDISDAAKELRKAYYKEWRKKNPEKVREKNRRYWERKALKEREVKKDATE